jgi:hypothetical protein
VSSNDAAYEALNAQIRRLQDLDGAGERYAPEVADVLHQELDAQIAAGVGPDGTPWPKTQAGSRALLNASAALETKALGNVVLAILRGPTALHNNGFARGGIRRQILPSARLPGKITDAIRTVVTRRLREDVTGEK